MLLLNLLGGTSIGKLVAILNKQKSHNVSQLQTADYKRLAKPDMVEKNYKYSIG